MTTSKHRDRLAAGFMALLVPGLLACAVGILYGLYRLVLFLVHVSQSRPDSSGLNWTDVPVIVFSLVFNYVCLYVLGWIILAVGRKVSGNPAWGTLPESEDSDA